MRWSCKKEVRRFRDGKSKLAYLPCPMVESMHDEYEELNFKYQKEIATL